MNRHERQIPRDATPSASPLAAADVAVQAGRATITPRAVIIGLACVALLCYVTPYNDFKVGATFLSGNQFPVGAFFVLTFLALPVNAVLRMVRAAWAFTRSELLTVWLMIVAACGLPAAGMMRYLIPYIAAPTYYSNSANNWENKVWGALPPWLRVNDPVAAQTFYTGLPRGSERVPWEAWATPLFFWGIPAVLFIVAQFCLASLLRRQWVENERFAFPLVQLPLLIAEEPEPGRKIPPVFRQPPLWIGAFLAFALHGLNGGHQLYPFLPEVQTAWNLNDFLTVPPYDQIGQFPMNFYPLVIGLAFLLPTEVSFSLWFFFFVYKAEILFGASHNYLMPTPLGSSGQKQFHSLQAFGGALGLCSWILYSARSHLRDVWEKATNGSRAASIDDTNELMPFRVALWTLFGAYAGIGVWLVCAGVPALLACVTLLVLTLALVVISYLVTQAGTLYMGTSYGSIDAWGATVGTSAFPASAWYQSFRFEWIFCRDTRELMLPQLLTGTKAGETAHIPLRPLLFALGLAVTVGLTVSAYSFLSLPYLDGGANGWRNAWTVTRPANAIKIAADLAGTPQPAVPTNALHILGGYVLTLGLLIVRARAGWGLHPIGFIGASASAGHYLWASLLVGWLAKTLALRYGGMSAYRRGLPFFFGLIVGDALSAALWILIGYLTGTGYVVMPQ